MFSFIKKTVKPILLILFLLLTISSANAASDYFVLRTAAEDKTFSDQGIVHYVSSAITTIATADGITNNYGPETLQSTVIDPTSSDAFVDFWNVPTNSRVTATYSSPGYDTDWGDLFVSSSLSSAYESGVQTVDETRYGYRTRCTTFYDSNSWRWYDCTVSNNGIDSVFMYTRLPDSSNPSTRYDLAVVTGKLTPQAAPVCNDFDGDGYSIGGISCGPIDCNDNNNLINPGASEICNGIDDDCDGLIDEDNVCPSNLNSYDYYCDADNDNYFSMTIIGTCNGTDNSCIPAGCRETQGNDCVDTNNLINPGANEICNGIDDDCDGIIDEGCSVVSGIINTDLTPNYPRDSDDLSCNINVNFYNVGNITINYEFTEGLVSSGTFICENSSCFQQLTVDNEFTNPKTYITCNAWFEYNGVIYFNSDREYINKDLEEPKESTNAKVTVANARFLQTKDSNPGDKIHFNIGLNTKKNKLDDATAVLTIIGFNSMKRYSVGPFNMKDGDSLNRIIEVDIPKNTKSGTYVARLVISDGNYRFVKHRVFYVK